MLALGEDDERIRSAPEVRARLDFVVVVVGSVARMIGQEEERCRCRIHEESSAAVIAYVNGFWKREMSGCFLECRRVKQYLRIGMIVTVTR